jgi:dolichyl-phosphate beta-glucosyltransferase
MVSFNLMLLLVPPVSAWAAFIAARRLTGRFWAALLAGAAYGLTPFELVHSWQGQPNLTVIALFPLMVYLVLRWWDGTLGRTWFVLLMAVAMAVEFYTFNEAFADMTAAWAGALVIGFAVAGRAARPKVARLGLLIAIAYAGAVAASAPYLVYALRHYPTALTRQQPAFSLHLIRLVLPVSDKLFGLTSLIRYSNHLGRTDIDDYVGLPLLLIPFALAVFARSNRIARLLAIAFVFVIALAAGPVLIIGNRQLVHLPWGSLWSLPIARSAEPSRLIIFAYLVLAIALALWLAAPTGSRLVKAARWGLGLLAVAMLIADLPTSYGAVDPVSPGYQPPATMRPVNQPPAFITDGLYRQYLRPGETVVIVTYRGNAGLLFQADTGFYFRIAGGFINASLTTRQDALPAAVGDLSRATPARIRQFKDYVRSAGIGAIVVERAWAQPWMLTVFGKAGLHGTSVGGVTIYPTGYGQPNQATSAGRA